MTKLYYVQRKAEDLKLGNMYVHWARDPEEHYQAPCRILGIIKTRDKRIKISLDDLSQRSFNPEHIVIVQEVA